MDKNVLTTYDSIDNHLKLAGEFDRAAVPMGMYIAWALNLGLIKSEVVAQHEQLVMRVRMQDAKGSELLMSVGGALIELLIFPMALNDIGNFMSNNVHPEWHVPDDGLDAVTRKSMKVWMCCVINVVGVFAVYSNRR